MSTGYAHRVVAAYAAGTIDPRGAWAVTVAHDDDCPHRHGKGDCACVPDITARNLATGTVIEIGLDGEALTQGATQ